MSTRKKLLVTGASGFIGRQALSLLDLREWEVHAVTRAGPQEGAQGILWHTADLLRPNAPEELVQSVAPSHLLHLAWNATPGQFWTAPNNIDWLRASLALYQAFVAVSGKRAVFCGSCAEYDWTTNLLDEVNTPLRPDTLYGAAKAALGNVLMAAASHDKTQVAWGRVFFLYGPDEDPVRLVPHVICALLQGRPALCTDGSAERDFMHVRDVAAALIAVLKSDYCGPINIASGQCIKMRDVIGLIGDMLGRPDLIQLGARHTPPSEPPRLAATTEILRERVGFTPRYDLSDGLADTIAWWRRNIVGRP